MTWSRRGLWVGVLGAILLFGAAGAQGLPRSRKLIATGWDKPDQKGLREHAPVIDQQPFQGVMMSVVGTRDNGKPCSLRYAHTGERWQREWFASAAADLRAAELNAFSDNFVSIGANPGNVDWFDDDGWAAITQHWAVAAWIAREAGFRGFLFDPEPYQKPYRQFAYASQAGHGEHSFAAYCEKARERGRQVMQAVAAEYPEVTIFCYFMNSVNRTAALSSQPQAVLESSGYGLFPAFIDGWLDAIPAGMTLVDGCESAYLFNSELQYLRAAVQIKGDCQALVSPENRARYRSQVQVSFGVYLDAYWNPAESRWQRWRVDCGDLQPVEKLLENLRNALGACDEYVWVYGEKFRWWPTDNARVFPQSWPQALPGIDLALRLARNPLDYARYLVAQAPDAARENLARNGDFASETAATNAGVQADWSEGGAPAGWSTWKMSEEPGGFAWDREAAAARAWGVRESGCFIQSYAVTPGESFAIRARTRNHGKSRSWIRIRWQTAEGSWTMESADVTAMPEAADADEWAEIFSAAVVPPGVGRLVLLLGMGNQWSAEDVTWFDDVEVYRLTATDAFSQDPVRWDLEQPHGP